jgi:hypothetical protein
LSIFSHIKGAIQGFAKGGISGGIAGAIGGQNNAPNPKKLAKLAQQGRTATSAAATVVKPGAGVVSLLGSASSAIKTTLPALRTIGTVASRALPVVGTAVLAGEAIYDAFGNQVGTRRRRRRMNPMNARAARRAIRRVKAVRKMLQQIERQLPKQRAAAPRRAAGGGRVTEFIRQG